MKSPSNEHGDERGVSVPQGLRCRQGSPDCPRSPGGDSPGPSGADTALTFPAWMHPAKRPQAGGAGAWWHPVCSQAVTLLSLALLSSDSLEHQLREDPGPSGLKSPSPHPGHQPLLPGPPSPLSCQQSGLAQPCHHPSLYQGSPLRKAGLSGSTAVPCRHH